MKRRGRSRALVITRLGERILRAIARRTYKFWVRKRRKQRKPKQRKRK